MHNCRTGICSDYIQGEINEQAYVRVYSHSRNYDGRYWWTAETRQELDEMVNEHTSESSFRVEVIRFICDTDNYVAEEI